MDYMVCDITHLRDSTNKILGILKNCDDCVKKVFQNIDIVTIHNWHGLESSLFVNEANELKNINNSLNEDLIGLIKNVNRFIDKVENTDNLYSGKFMRIR